MKVKYLPDFIPMPDFSNLWPVAVAAHEPGAPSHYNFIYSAVAINDELYQTALHYNDLRSCFSLIRILQKKKKKKKKKTPLNFAHITS